MLKPNPQNLESVLNVTTIPLLAKILHTEYDFIKTESILLPAIMSTSKNSKNLCDSFPKRHSI